MPLFLSARRAICCSLIAAATLLFVNVPARASGPAAPSLIPYTTTILAGGGPTATYAKNSLCPKSGLTELDSYGDGCLATELVLKAPRYITQDANGNYFFSDETATIVRRIDAATGIVSLVAGGGTSSGVSTVNATCPSGVGMVKSIEGDGCPGTDAFLGKPAGLAFSPLTGNLYFSDSYSYSVHEITATNNCTTGPPVICFITPSATTGASTGTMTLIAGTPTGDGYFAGDPSTATNQVAETGTTSTSSYLYKVFGLAFDPQGDLYLEDNYNEAVFALNTNTSGSTTVGGITIPAGDITKIMGSQSSTPTCTNGVYPAANGCTYPSGTPTATTGSGSKGYIITWDGPLDVALDASGNIYFDEFYWYNVGKLAAATDIYTPYAGIRGTKGTTVTARGLSTTIGISSPAGLTFDSVNNGNNLYIADGANGFIWRVDSATQSMYAIAGGATTTYASNGSTACSVGASGVNSTDTYGDNCPGRAAEFSNTGGTRFTTAQATTTPASLTGIFIDNAGNLLAVDSGHALIRKIASGTAFGKTQTGATQTLEIHYGATDTQNASQAVGYVLTSGASNFTLGTATCTAANSDTTTDCTLPITVAATTASTSGTNGVFSGTLQVTSAGGLITSFPLTGTIVAPVASNTAIAITPTCPPGGVSTIAVTVSNTVGFASGGTVAIFVNGTQINSQTLPLTRTVSTNYVFIPSATPYSVYATYSGDAQDLPSTAGSAGPPAVASTQQVASFTSSPIILAAAPGASSTITVAAGGTALYSFTATAFTAGTYQFFCNGLPAGAACVFFPPPPTSVPTSCAAGSIPTTIALSVTTTQQQPVVYGFGAYSKNKWMLLGSTLPALLLAMLVMFRRRRSPLKYSGVLMALAFLVAMAGTLGCGAGYGPSVPGTPAGSVTAPITTNFTVTASDGLGNTSAPLTLTLKVN